MPKGKTSQPLKIVVDPEMISSDLIQALLSQGHDVQPLPPECINADVVFGTNCHIMTSEMLTEKGIVSVALRAARKRKKNAKNRDI
jgi:hypothetical protein